MKINYNISAMISNDHLLFNEARLSSSTERLSSGLKVNRAEDDPTGMAIGIKMRSQIRALEQAEKNSQNGTSVLETADGALGELTSMLQRMRELSVEAANDTQTPADRANIQLEMDELIEEVDRISKDTEFNTLSLFDGTLNTRAYATTSNTTYPNSVTVIDTKNVTAGEYVFTVQAAASRGTVTGTNNTTSSVPEGTLTINGISIAFTSGMSSSDVWDALKEGCEYAGVEVTSSESTFTLGSSSLEFKSCVYGDSLSLEISASTASVATFLGLQDTLTASNEYSYTTTGTDVVISLDSTSSFTGMESYVTNGQRVTIHGENGFEMIVEAESIGDVTVNATDMGALYLQIGASENQSITVDIPEMSAHVLGIDEINVQNSQGAGYAITLLDTAIAHVNSVRSTIGAAENRLEHTKTNLDTTQETMTSAYSRIMDVDMAEEMTTFTNMQILVQAGTSVLAQANELPDQALQMLR